jgi:galactokinase
LEIAKLCQRAEHRFVNVQSGLLDQVCSIFGEDERAVYFDCRSEEVELVPFPGDLALVIAQSGKARELRSGLYNMRREETQRAAKALNVSTLRDATASDVQQCDLPDLLRRRALHITGENERVRRARELLIQGNGRAFGELMYVSHESSRSNFENSTPELDRLVEIASGIDGVFGARLTGGGFGGATITLCAEAAVKSVAGELERAAESVFITRASAGARVL